mgnify:CR=1 FL=1
MSPSLWNAIKSDLKISEPSIGYGATEASPGILHLPPGMAPVQQGEVGRPLVNVTVQALEEGLRFSGPNLCDAYIENGKVFFPNELILNDRVQERADGVFVYEGRSDSILNRGGQKLSFLQIERRLSEIEGLEVVGVPLRDRRLGEELGLVVEGVSLDEDSKAKAFQQIHSLLSQEFGVVLSFENIRWVKSLPRNLNQKKSRGAAKKLFKPKLPHRAPMLWAKDLVSATSDDEGLVSISLEGDSLALRSEVKELAFIEWIAQAFGLISLETAEGMTEAPQVMLVGASGRWLSSDRPKAKEKILVQAKRTHRVGPFSIVEGKVFREGESAPLAEARLKVFAEA